MGRISDLSGFGPISPFRLRTKLLLLALTTLALPWAGCQYAREMETVLRESEQQSLLAVTTTDCRIAQGPPGTAVSRRFAARPSMASNARDITPVVLSGAPLIDGRADEWDTDCAQPHPRRRARRRRPAAAGGHPRALAVPRAAGARRQGGLRRLDARAARLRHHRRSHLAGLRRQARRPAAAVLRQHRRRHAARPPHRNPRIRPRGSGRRAAHRGGVAALARRLRARDRHPAVAGRAAHRRAHRRSRPARRGAHELRHARSRRICAPPAG